MGQIAGIEDSSAKTEVGPGLSKVIEETIFGITLEDTVDKIVEGSIEMIIIGVVTIIEVGIGLERHCTQETIVVTELENTNNSRSRSGSRATTNRDRIRCYNCEELSHL